MHVARLLLIYRHECLGDGVLDMSLHQRRQIGRQHMCKVVGDIRSKNELLDLDRKILPNERQKSTKKATADALTWLI